MTQRTREFIASSPTSNVILIWHNRLALALGGFWRKGKSVPLTSLVSASGDGAIAEQVIGAFGIGSARVILTPRLQRHTRIDCRY